MLFSILQLGVFLITAVHSNEVYEYNETEEVLYTYDIQGVKVDVLRRGNDWTLDINETVTLLFTPQYLYLFITRYYLGYWILDITNLLSIEDQPHQTNYK